MMKHGSSARKAALILCGCFLLLASARAVSGATLPNLRFLPGREAPPSFWSTGGFNNVAIENISVPPTIPPSSPPSIPTTPPAPLILPTIALEAGAVVELGSENLPANLAIHGAAAIGSFQTVGDVNIMGNVALETGAYLYFDASGATYGDVDLLRLRRSLDVAGTIRIVFRDGFAPAAGDVLPLVYYTDPVMTSVSLQWGTQRTSWAEIFEFANLAEAPVIQLFIVNNTLGLQFLNDSTFIPEPSASALAVVVASGLIASGRRRRTGRGGVVCGPPRRAYNEF
jgi:hypothetical protein